MVIPGTHVGRGGGKAVTMPIFPDLKGASVFITGGGSGIGAALTKGFVEQGAKVAFVGRSDYHDFATEIGALFIQCDVTDTAALQEAIDQAAQTHGGLDVMVNNAADDMRMVAADVTPQDWDAQQDINLKPYFFGSQRAASHMKNGGSIINFSSITYMFGAADMVPYVTANAGIVGMTRALAREWGPQRIRVNALAPGWVLTEKQMDKWATPEALEAYRVRQCLPDMMVPDDIVGPVLFLASDASAKMTSQTLVVDSGTVVTG